LRFAYADPPYIGISYRYPEKTEVDHAALVARLVADYPDGWALSCTSSSLQYLLGLCPEGVRIGAWVKPYAPFKINVNPAYAWEPLIVYGGRRRGRDKLTMNDWIKTNTVIHQSVLGEKPELFVWWLIEMLGMEPSDELDDLFPGSGNVTRSLDVWRSQRTLCFGGENGE